MTNFIKEQFAFLINDPSFVLLQEEYFTFEFQEIRFQIFFSDWRLIEMHISPICYIEKKVAFLNLIEYINNEAGRKNCRPDYFALDTKSYEGQIAEYASLIKENLPEIKIFCSKENYLKNCELLRNYMLKTYPQIFKVLS